MALVGGALDLTEPDAIRFDVGVSGLTCLACDYNKVTNVTGGVGSYEYSFVATRSQAVMLYLYQPTGVSIDIEIIVKTITFAKSLIRNH